MLRNQIIQLLLVAAASSSVLAHPGPLPCKPCTIWETKTKTECSTKYSTTVTTTHCPLSLPAVLTSTSTVTDGATTVTTTVTTAATQTTTVLVSPSPTLSNTEPTDAPARRDAHLLAPCKHCTYETRWTTVATTTTLPTTTVAVSSCITPISVTTTTITSTSTSTSASTVTPTATVAAYTLNWDQDTCGYNVAHIVDIAVAGDEGAVIDACADLCTADAGCVVWEAYYSTLDGGSGRCATFASAYNQPDLKCPDPFYPYSIGYSVGATKNQVT